MSKKKKIGALLLVNFVILATMLYAFEGYLRLTDPLKKYSPDGMVGGITYTFGHRVDNNRYGFRERDFMVPKPQGVYRIMVLGDSLTWGVGLAPEERYTKLLEDALSKAFPGKKFEVLNFGLPGIPTVQERDILREHVDKVDPDLIVVGFCYNDPQVMVRERSVDWGNFRHESPLVSGLWRKLEAAGLKYTSKRIKTAVYRLDEIKSRVPRWEVTIEESYKKNSQDWIQFVQALQDIKNTSDARHLPTPIFAVLDSGTYRDRPTDYSHPDEALRRRLRWYHQGEAAAAKIGFETFNYEKEIMRDFANESLSVNVMDAHPSPKLNRLYARKLFDIIAGYVRASVSANSQQGRNASR
jgi:lysophospholipase L1-like esterase